MLMITGPSGPDRPRGPTRNRRSTDPGNATPRVEGAARAQAAPRMGRRATDPKADPQPTADASAEVPHHDPKIGRPFAPLVAQLIAGHLALPQTRVRRRGSSADAVEAYERRRRQRRDAPTLATEA